MNQPKSYFSDEKRMECLAFHISTEEDSERAMDFLYSRYGVEEFAFEEDSYILLGLKDFASIPGRLFRQMFPYEETTE